MRRFAPAFVVALLTFSASGLTALVAAEPCAGYEQSQRDDSACPPTCVTCGCCAQAAEPVAIVVDPTLHIALADIAIVVPALPATQTRDILHVPKTRLS